MNKISDKVKVNKLPSKNRVLFPPVVCFNWADTEGFETEDRAKHYGDRAKGGSGLVVIEATGISKEGRIIENELGLWSDDHEDQFTRIAKACHDQDSIVLVQIVHAGMKSFNKSVFSASEQTLKRKTCEAMSLEHIERVKNEFVSSAVRAFEAGLDGVEIHGAHGYLLSQFTSKETNKREDKYGGSLENRLRLSIEIIEAVRAATSEDFIIGYRFGVNDPTFEEDIIFAKQLEELGVDILNVSSGIGANSLETPVGFEESQIAYMGVEIKKHVNIPVACVGSIRRPEQAKYLIEKHNVDFVAVARGILADPNWGNKAVAGEDVDVCHHCKPWCKYAKNGHKCPWRVQEAN